jgi:hypothetical protein
MAIFSTEFESWHPKEPYETTLRDSVGPGGPVRVQFREIGL